MVSKFRQPVGVVVCAAVAAFLLPASASAFVVQHTSGGLPVHWAGSNVEFVIDSSVTQAADGAGPAIVSALQAWSGVSGTPELSTSSGKGAKKPEVDGINTIFFAPDGYAPAGKALAITVVSFDDKTGEILDADIVINGAHAFAVFAASARAADGTPAVSTEGASDDDNHQFDLQHVVTHEMGHALGLGDVRDNSTAVMYAYTKPNDASSRAPAADDLSGIGELYTNSASASSPAGGCGATVAATPVTSRDNWAFAALMAGAAAWVLSRRRAHRAAR